MKITRYNFGFSLILNFTALSTPAFAETFTVKSLDSIENICPHFSKYSSDAALLMECDGNIRNLRLVKKLNFDGASYMKDPDARAKDILSDIHEIINENLSIERRVVLFCHSSVDTLGRCKAVYTLTGPRGFDEAALAINPKDDKINSFSYFLTVSWERGKAGARTAP